MPSRPSYWSPGQPHPKRADRKTLAAIISHEVMPVSPRTLETWPLLVTKARGKALYDVAAGLKMAEERIAATRVYRLALVLPDLCGETA